MPKKRTPESQLKALPEYGEIVSSMEAEAISVWTDFIRQYVGSPERRASKSSGIYMNKDRVLQSQMYQELAQYDLYAEIERDPHFGSVMQSAKLDVAGMDWDIYPYIGLGQKEATDGDKKIAAFVKYVLTNIPFFPQHLYNMMDALGKGFSASELIWSNAGGYHVVTDILNRPQRRIQFDVVTREPKSRDLDNPYMGNPLPPRKVIIHRVSATWSNPFGDPLDASLYWIWLFKRMVFKFFMQHLEVGASSVPIVEHPANADDKMKGEALAIAQQIRQGAFGRIPTNLRLIWAESKNAASISQAYDTFIRLTNDEASKLIKGNLLTTEASGSNGNGSRSLGDVHKGTQDAYNKFRASGLASTLNSTLIKWLVDVNFGQFSGYPQFKFETAEEENLVNEASIVEKLDRAGYEIPEEELSAKFKYTIHRKQQSQKPGVVQPSTVTEGEQK